MENLEIYNKLREVPEGAKKTISGGRLKGMTDINPMWRIEKLTEQFGPCGFGWRYEIVNQWTEAGANNETVAHVKINLFVKMGEQWSEAIPGLGGAMFISKEKSGMFTSDECYKMALTDAISVACKALGMAADVYWANGRTKYTTAEPQPAKKIFTKEMESADNVMKWLYDIAVKKKKQGKPFSVAAALEYFYIIQPEQIEQVSKSLSEYLVKNNLQV